MQKNNRKLLSFVAGALLLAVALLLVFVFNRRLIPATPQVLAPIRQVAQRDTPTHPDSPIATPTPIPTPYVTATPAPTLPSVDKLDPGLKLVYAESDTTGTKTIIWIATVKNLENRKQIATFEHRWGYPTIAKVSLDGKWIAIRHIPPNYGERGLRRYGGELWIVKTDGTDLHQLPGRVRGILDWSPQGEVTIESGADIVNPTMPEDSVRPEYYAITPDGVVTKIMGAALENAAVDPVGWSADGTEFYYTWRGMGVGDLALGDWELRAISRKDGNVRTVMKTPYKAAQYPALLVSRTRLSYVAYTEKEQVNIVSDINGKNEVVLNQAARNEDSKYWLWGTLSSTNDSLLLRGIPQPGRAIVELTEVKIAESKEPIRKIIAEMDESFLPVRWSPDEQWVVLDKIPSDPTFAGIMNLEQAIIIDIPKAQSANRIITWGWVEN